MEEDGEAAEKICIEIVKGRALLDPECTADKVEQEASWCQVSMGNGFDAVAKKIRICATLMRWWNADIKERRKAVGREKRMRQNSEKPAKLNAELQNSIRLTKSEIWCEYFKNQRVAEIWEWHDT